MGDAQKAKIPNVPILSASVAVDGADTSHIAAVKSNIQFMRTRGTREKERERDIEGELLINTAKRHFGLLNPLLSRSLSLPTFPGIPFRKIIPGTHGVVAQ